MGVYIYVSLCKIVFKNILSRIQTSNRGIFNKANGQDVVFHSLVIPTEYTFLKSHLEIDRNHFSIWCFACKSGFK